jgi:CRP-like cAMP-binding protein
VRKYGDGALVHAPGMARSALLVVLEGSLRMACVSPHGAESTLAVLERGSFQNLHAALGTPDTQAEIYAFGATEVVAFARTSLAHVVREHPELDTHFKRIAVDRIGAAVSLFSDLHAAPLEQRLARRLLAQAMDSRGAAVVALHATHAMLAGMLRASRSQVSTMLKAWERRSWVRLGYRGLVMEDVKALRKVAGAGVRPF